MNEPHKLPPDKVDALAQRLQGSLKRRRPRTWLIVMGAMVLAIAGLSLLAWWLHNRTAPPRLEIIVFDTLAAPDEAPHVAAQLVFPDQGDYSPSLLADREVLFFSVPAPLPVQEPEARATTDAHGRAVVDWSPLPPDKPATVQARYIDAPNKQGSNDQASMVAWEPGSKILVVDVEETLALIEPAQWLGTHPASITTRPDAAAALQEAQRKRYRIAYLAAFARSPAIYPRVRAWVHATRAEKDRFPPGPVLGRQEHATEMDADRARRERVSDLKARFGNNITFVTRTASVPGVRVIALDPRAGQPGVIRVPGWAEVIPLLDAPPKN
jgi:hypothetical protein